MKMNKISLVAAAAVMGLGSVSAQAGTAGSTVTVDATLNAKCVVNSAPSIAFVYDAFQSQDLIVSGDVTLKCTRGFGMPAASLGADTGGILGGLKYTLGVAAANKNVSGAAATGGNGAGADEYSITVTGTMLKDQAGDSTDGNTNKVHTLTVTY